MTYINQKTINSSYRNVMGEPWDLDELKKFFKSVELPAMIKLNGWTTITNVRNFLNSHFEYCKANNGSEVFKPYYNRLLELKQILK